MLLNVLPVVALAHPFVLNAHEVGVGFEDGRFVGNEGHAVHQRFENAVFEDVRHHLTPVHGGIIVVESHNSVPHLHVRIKGINLVGNLTLEPHHYGDGQNHDHNGEHHTRQSHIQAGRPLLFARRESKPSRYEPFVTHCWGQSYE